MPALAFGNYGHKQDVAIILAPRAAKVRMAEAIERVVTIMVATATVPAFEPSVGTGLNLSEGDDGSGIGVAVAVGADQGVYISTQALLAASKESHGQQDRKKGLSLF
jgi:hypothetical protein